MAGQCAYRRLLPIRRRANRHLKENLEELEQFAIGNQQLRDASWGVVHRSEGTDRPVLLGFEADGVFSASRIVDPEFLAEAHRIIGSKLLLASIPHSRALFVADASPLADRAVHAGFARWTQRHFDRAAGVDALTAQPFLVRSGELIGFYEPAADE